MTAERRLDKVEAALTPTQRVLAWLDDTHAWGTLSAYVDSLLDKSPDDFPINRLAHDAASATRAALRGKPPEAVAAAVRRSVLATVFRFHLVLRINVVTHETIDRETLIYVAMAGQLALLGRDDRPERLTDEGIPCRARPRSVSPGRRATMTTSCRVEGLSRQRRKRVDIKQGSSPAGDLTSSRPPCIYRQSIYRLS